MHFKVAPHRKTVTAVRVGIKLFVYYNQTEEHCSFTSEGHKQEQNLAMTWQNFFSQGFLISILLTQPSPEKLNTVCKFNWL